MVIDNSTGSGELGLAPSALIARLRLQVRSARRELAEGRAQLDAFNADVERETESLRNRLLALVAERRAEIETRLEHARANTDSGELFVRPSVRSEAVAATGGPPPAGQANQGAAPVGSAQARQFTRDEDAERPLPINPFHPVYGDEALFRHDDPIRENAPRIGAVQDGEAGPGDDGTELDPWTTTPVVWGAEPASWTEVPDLEGVQPTGPDGPSFVPSMVSSAPTDLRVVLDSSGFAEVFAAALAAALAERPEPWTASIPTAAPPAPRRSFWAGTWHADVVLSLVSLLIVIIILIAWAS